MVDAAPQRLPRGRHRLTREQVEESQRNRMLLAMAEAMAENGYVGTAVADVLKRAGVSRETFYQHFSSKLDCFMHAFDMAGEILLTRVSQSQSATASTPLERFEDAFTAYLDTLANNPAFARVFLVEVFAAGPEAMARRAALQARIVDDIAELLSASSKQDRFACQALVAAVSSLVTEPVISQDAKALDRLRADVINLVRRAVGRRDEAR